MKFHDEGMISISELKIRVAAPCLCLLIFLTTTSCILAETRVEVMDTYPAGKDVSLKNGQTYYMRLKYKTDESTHLWVRPYFQGKEASAGSNPSRVYPPGSGEALGWFFLFDPGIQVDEIRISAGSGAPGNTKTLMRYPIKLISSSSPPSNEPKPEWVDGLQKINTQILDQERRRTEAEPTTAGEAAFINGFMIIVILLAVLGIGGPVLGIWFWRGVWRWLALIPALTTGFVVLRIIVDGFRDPTSHNLWPFEILIWCGLSCAWMGVLTGIRKVFQASKDHD